MYWLLFAGFHIRSMRVHVRDEIRGAAHLWKCTTHTPGVYDIRFADLHVKRSHATGSGSTPISRLKMGWLHLGKLDLDRRIGIPLPFEAISMGGVGFVVASCVSEESKNIIFRHLADKADGTGLGRGVFGRRQNGGFWKLPQLALLPFGSSKMGQPFQLCPFLDTLAFAVM